MKSPFDSPLSGFRSPFGYGRRPGFSVAALFANSEQGVWFAPDPDTCFTDTTDITPAGVGDAVALMLDKSQGASYRNGEFTGLGPELVEDGGFDEGTVPDGWEINTANGVISIVDGKIQFEDTNGDMYIADYELSGLTIGSTYQIKYINSDASGAGLSTQRGTTNNNISLPTEGNFSSLFVATHTTHYFYVRRNFGATETIDDFSVRELPGFHATQPTAAARPLLQQTAGGLWYLEFDGVDDTMETSSITPGTDKGQTFAGVNLNSTNTRQAISSFPEDFSTTPDNSIRLGLGTKNRIPSLKGGGDTETSAQATTVLQNNVSAVLAGTIDISGELHTMRFNGVEEGTASVVSTGSFRADNGQIGALRGSAHPLNGQLFSLVHRFGPNLTTDTIQSTEKYVANKTGVTL